MARPRFVQDQRFTVAAPAREREPLVSSAEELPRWCKMTAAAIQDLGKELSASERELLRELLHALRTIRYGSVVLTVHDGRVVEIHKTERIRRSTPSQKD